ncbi:hypothetical protein POVCU2_0006000, partial [Plasmodium ovale curtisi]
NFHMGYYTNAFQYYAIEGTGKASFSLVGGIMPPRQRSRKESRRQLLSKWRSKIRGQNSGCNNQEPPPSQKKISALNT